MYLNKALFIELPSLQMADATKFPKSKIQLGSKSVDWGMLNLIYMLLDG
jgi:hypothetical protein